MAHFARIENDLVVDVIVVSDDVLIDKSGVESEALGQAFCSSLLGGEWKQTSYNGNIRSVFAGKGFEYNREHDCFVVPSPFKSWVFNASNLCYEPPVPKPNVETGKDFFSWNEEGLEWEYNPSLIRAYRDKLLSETDYAALQDVVMSPEMAAYRQALRDITDQAGFPHEVVWPTKPTEATA